MKFPIDFSEIRKLTILALSGLILFVSVSCKTGGCLDPLNSNYAAFADFDDASCAPDNKPTLTLNDSVSTIVENDSGIIELVAEDDHGLAEYSYNIFKGDHLIQSGKGRMNGMRDAQIIAIGIDPDKDIFEGALRGEYYGIYRVEVTVKDVYGKATTQTSDVVLLDNTPPEIRHVGFSRNMDYTEFEASVAAVDLSTLLYMNIEVWKVVGEEKTEMLHKFDYTVPQVHRNTELNYYHPFSPKPGALQSGDEFQVFAMVTDASGLRTTKTSDVGFFP